MEKKHKTPHRYSAEFKIRAILDMRKHRLGYEETARKYWPGLTRLEAHNHIKSLHGITFHTAEPITSGKLRTI